MLPLSRKVVSLQPSQTLLLFNRAKQMVLSGIDVISLTAGEPDFPTPQQVKNGAVRAIEENFTKYTPNQGIPKLLMAIAEKFKKDNRLHFEPSQILVSNGAKHSVYNALQAICNRGDEVIIPAPYWVSYPEMAKLVDAKPVIVKTSPANQFKMTASQLKKAITKKTKLLIHCSPSNPTGAVYSIDETAELARVIARTGIYVISDEIYEKILYDGAEHHSIGSIEAIRDQVVTVNGVSKAYSMTGWRIGFMGAHKSIVAAAEKFQGQMTSNASSISQRAALEALTTDLQAELGLMVGEFDRRRRFFKGELEKLGIQFIEPKGAFYLFFNVKPFLKKSADGAKIKTADELCEYLLTRHHVAMVPGEGFGAPDWIRASYACSMNELEKAAERLHAGFKALK